MANHLLNIMKKELKEIMRDPRLLLGMIIPIIILPLMGGAIRTAMDATEVEMATMVSSIGPGYSRRVVFVLGASACPMCLRMSFCSRMPQRELIVQ